MTTNLPQVKENNPISSIEYVQDVVQKLMKHKHYAKLGEEGLFALTQKAKAIGIDPLDAIGGDLYFLQGRVGMGAETMNRLIRERGHSIQKDPKSDDKLCTLYGKRADNGDTWVSSFSIEEAKAAGLTIRQGGMYDKWRAGMLYNRAMSFLARQLFPDVIKGCGYTHEELVEISNSKKNIPQKQSDSIVELISKEKLSGLMELLKQCDNEYIDKLYKFLNGPQYGIETLSDLPDSMYEKVKAGIMKNIEENTVKIELTTEEKEEAVDE